MARPDPLNTPLDDVVPDEPASDGSAVSDRPVATGTTAGH